MNKTDNVYMGAVSENIENPEFSESYSEARLKYLQTLWSLKKSGVSSESFELEIKTKEDAQLFADAVYFPAKVLSRPSKAKKLFILSSGLHGVEAPLGSALQLKFLKETVPHLNREEIGVLVFHSLNPYGFLKATRVNEKNVDLNRNFFVHLSDYKSSNHSYQKYQSILSPKKPVGMNWIENLKTAFHMILPALQGKVAKQELTQAFAGGQYEDSRGIYFGGQSPEPQVEWVKTILDKTVKNYSEILLFDIHTGLGKASSLQLISSQKTKIQSPEVLTMQAQVKNHENVFFVSTDTEGFYKTSGDFIDYVYDYSKTLYPDIKINAFTAEFGTLGESLLNQLSTSVRIILENQGRQWGYTSSGTEIKVKENFKELFNPHDSKWRENALALGMTTIESVLSEYIQSRLSKKTGT